MLAVPDAPSTFTSPLAQDANRGRVALVTGGGTGIGRAIARELAGSGAGLVICGRRREPLMAARSEVEALGVECLALPTDIREPDEVATLVDAALERFGRIDVLVNNAGGQFEAPAEARKATTDAISSGMPSLPSGTCRLDRSTNSAP